MEEKKKYYGTISVRTQHRFTQRVGRMLVLSDEKLQLTTENFGTLTDILPVS